MPKRMEIPTGTRYGALTVKELSLDHKDSSGTKLWECACDCGKVCYARGSDLRANKKKSCGCRIGAKSQVNNLIGQQFHYLTVIKEAPSRRTSGGRSIARWECKCKCGNIITVDAGSLTSGNTKSCGCYNKENQQKSKINLTGKKFNKLRVIDYNNGEGTWNCQCDCGNMTKVSTYSLNSGNTKSCGCLKKEAGALIYNDLTGKSVGLLTVMYQLSERDKGRNIIWHCKCECGNEVDIVSYSLTKKNPTMSCGCVKSKGELKISQILQDNKIKFETQKTFDTCRFPETNHLAFFDFYLPDYNCLIEYQGEQHYKASGTIFTEEIVNKIQQRDNYKKEWCQKNKILLITIPYTQFNILMIDDLLPKGGKHG